MMKYTYLILLLCVVALKSGAQPLGSIDDYLKSERIHEGAKAYYNKEVKAATDDSTMRIADSMLTQNDTVRPFYILQVSDMFVNAERELAMKLFPYCWKLLEEHPGDLTAFLYCDSKYVYDDFKKYWATAIAFQFRKERSGDVKEQLSMLREELAGKCPKKQHEQLSAFLDMVGKRL